MKKKEKVMAIMGSIIGFAIGIIVIALSKEMSLLTSLILILIMGISQAVGLAYLIKWDDERTNPSLNEEEKLEAK